MAAGSVDIQAFVNALEQDVRPRVLRAGISAAFAFANHVITESNRICPRKTGDLIKSSRVADPVEENGLIYVVVSYNTYYAAAVHERLDLHHEAPTQAKFLEISMRANAPRYPVYVINAMKQELGS